MNNDLDIDAGHSADRQQLFWKGAILLLCAGIFVLILWSGANNRPDPCLGNDAASQEACLAQSRAQALRPPAKGAFAPINSGSAYRSSN
ncbi:MAG: hypothetical protein JO134_12215 [Xanthobacteraceae bacterium]|nr:hypothetical protein [Xanthobacteraceae bacterium]